MRSVSGECACGCKGKTAIADRTSRRDGDVKGKPRRFIRGHHARKSFIEYIEEDRGFDTACWIWQKASTASNHGAYGSIWEDGRQQLAYAVFYKRKFGPTPAGCELHHKCRTKICVNPDHIQPLSRQEHMDVHAAESAEATRQHFSNITKCPFGHDYTKENTYLNPKTGYRCCRTCMTKRNRAASKVRMLARTASK